MAEMIRQTEKKRRRELKQQKKEKKAKKEEKKKVKKSKKRKSGELETEEVVVAEPVNNVGSDRFCGEGGCYC